MRPVTILIAVAIFATSTSVSPSNAQSKKVTQRPTVSSMAPGETVLFDDKSCPAGMIAKFTKAKNREKITKKCVHQ